MLKICFFINDNIIVVVLQVLDDVSLDGVVKFIKSEKCKNIITMAGAGISTSAGFQIMIFNAIY